MGGITVERSQKNNRVADIIALLDMERRINLVMPVEGTRAYNWSQVSIKLLKAQMLHSTNISWLLKKTGGFGTPFM